MWVAPPSVALGCTSPDSRFQDPHPGTVAGTAARETKAVRRIATLRIPETIDCRWWRSSENLPFWRHRCSRCEFQLLSVETVRQKADRLGSKEEIRNTKNARSGIHKPPASPAALSFHSVWHDLPECRSLSTDACGREPKKSTCPPVGAAPTTSSGNPNLLVVLQHLKRNDQIESFFD